MSTEYTIEVYKSDKRIKKDDRYGKNKVGLRFIKVMDFKDTVSRANAIVKHYEECGYVAELHETYVTKTNLMTGVEFKERYDRPYFCSPSSESYYSM